MEGRAKLSLLRLHNAFIPIKQLHLFGRSKSVRFYLKRFRSYVTRSNLRDSISRDLAYISLHLLDANRETHEHWVFATLSRHRVPLELAQADVVVVRADVWEPGRRGVFPQCGVEVCMGAWSGAASGGSFGAFALVAI
jgi:hypothetical protein